MQKVEVVLYHAGCFDGYMSNVIAIKAFRNNKHKEIPIVTHGVYPGPGLLDSLAQLRLKLENSNMLPCIVRSFDVSMGPQHYEYLQSICNDVLIFDHHQTTADLWAGRGYDGEDLVFDSLDDTPVVYSTKRSGCELAWQHYFPDQKQPDIVTDIGNRDTWREDYVNNVGDTQFISEAFYSVFTPGTRAGDLPKWMDALDWTKKQYGDLAELGRQLRFVKDQRMSVIRKHAAIRNIDGKAVAVLNAAWDQSDLGNLLCPDVDYVAIWYYSSTRRTYKVSLRSDKGKTDVSQVAAQYGGGGHKNAAGFETSELTQWL